MCPSQKFSFKLRIAQASVVLLLVCFAGASSLTVSRERLSNHIESAFKNPRSHLQPVEKESTRNYVYQFFKDLECENATLSNHTFMYSRPSEQSSYTGINYVYTLPGRHWGSSNDSVLLLGSHYDTVPGSPGIDDNGSGMAALLEATHLLSAAACQRNRTLVFVAFDFEEYGLNGSFQFVKNYLEPEILSKSGGKFEGAVVLETLLQYNNTPNSQGLPYGFDMVFPAQYAWLLKNEQRGNFLASAGRQTDLALISALYRAHAALPSDNMTVLNLTIPDGFIVPDLHRSDHYPFWLANKTAIFLTDTANFRGYMQTCYHNACDDISYLSEENLQFLAKTTQAVVNMFHPGTFSSGSETSTATSDNVTTDDPVAGILNMCLPSFWICLIGLLFGLSTNYFFINIHPSD